MNALPTWLSYPGYLHSTSHVNHPSRLCFPDTPKTQSDTPEVLVATSTRAFSPPLQHTSSTLVLSANYTIRPSTQTNQTNSPSRCSFRTWRCLSLQPSQLPSLTRPTRPTSPALSLSCPLALSIAWKVALMLPTAQSPTLAASAATARTNSSRVLVSVS